MLRTLFLSLALSVVFTHTLHAHDYYRLDEALPSDIEIASIAPVFDFDTDGCLPAAGISRSGDKNGGLKPSGSLTGGCRSTNFMDLSNTVHRYACTKRSNSTYCGHFYSLYFEKDQIFSGINSGHRHDWEVAVVWTVNGRVTHGSYSAHGNLTTRAARDLAFENGHLKIVYHKEGALTHAFRFGGKDERAENPYRRFVTPVIVSWFELQGQGWNNMVMRTLLSHFDYGSANLPVSDWRFHRDLNQFKPESFPQFSWSDIFAANGGKQERWQRLANVSSGLCMDIAGGRMENGTNVMQWDCHNEKWQKWHHDESTGMIHSLQDPRFCLDNSNRFENGANVQIWQCWGGEPQRFVKNNDGSFGMAKDRNQVLDGYGTAAGDNVGTWGNWGGDNQKWTLKP